MLEEPSSDITVSAEYVSANKILRICASFTDSIGIYLLQANLSLTAWPPRRVSSSRYFWDGWMPYFSSFLCYFSNILAIWESISLAATSTSNSAAVAAQLGQERRHHGYVGTLSEDAAVEADVRQEAH